MATQAPQSARQRLAAVRQELSYSALIAGLLIVLVVATLLFVQEPSVHNALHEFRHGAGITCH